MTKPIQKRTLETRARLIASARDIVASVGYERVRTEEVAIRAGVAKGTLFAHFKDKDALMDKLIGEEIDAHVDSIAACAPPQSVRDIVERLTPLWKFMTSERYVFDVILRHSGAAALSDIGVITETFMRQDQVLSDWMESSDFRRDIPARLQAEGVTAFAIQAMALHFCAAHQMISMPERMEIYLGAWLMPQ